MPTSRRTRTRAARWIWWCPPVDALTSVQLKNLVILSSRRTRTSAAKRTWTWTWTWIWTSKRCRLFRLLNFDFSEQDESLMWIWKHDDEVFYFSEQEMIGEKFSRCTNVEMICLKIGEKFIDSQLDHLIGWGYWCLMLTAIMKAARRLVKEFWKNKA